MKSLRDVLEAPPTDGGELPPTVGTFLRGLSIGALVGAAIAGSMLLQRRRHREGSESPEIAPERGRADAAP
jgi:hypothetical protein